MNVPYPAGIFTNNSYFYANNTFTLGSMSKPPNARTLISIDYSKLNPPFVGGITAYWFEIDIGSNPPLTISNPNVNSGSNVLTFLVSYGVPGVAYQLSVNITFGDASVRTDILYVEVPDENGCCGGGGVPYPLPGGPISIPPLNNIAGFLTGEGTVFINTGVRFFVSAVAPQSANILDQWYNTTTKVISEFVTDGGTTFWMPFNQVPRQAVQSLTSQALTVSALNTISPLVGSPDGDVVLLEVNGLAFAPLGLSPPFVLSGNNITWLSAVYSVNPGDTVNAIFSESIPGVNGFYMEALTVLSPNILSQLTNTPNGEFLELIVNGDTFLPVGVSPPFSVTGKTIAWLSTIYSLQPGNSVVAVYSY